MLQDIELKNKITKYANNSVENKIEQLITKILDPLINENYNIEEANQLENNEYIYNDAINEKIKNKKRKKMKNYNRRRGDWQCENCRNINFHFRTVCNICQKSKI